MSSSRYFTFSHGAVTVFSATDASVITLPDAKPKYDALEKNFKHFTLREAQADEFVVKPNSLVRPLALHGRIVFGTSETLEQVMKLLPGGFRTKLTKVEKPGHPSNSTVHAVSLSNFFLSYYPDLDVRARRTLRAAADEMIDEDKSPEARLKAPLRFGSVYRKYVHDFEEGEVQAFQASDSFIGLMEKIRHGNVMTEPEIDLLYPPKGKSESMRLLYLESKEEWELKTTWALYEIWSCCSIDRVLSSLDEDLFTEYYHEERDEINFVPHPPYERHEIQRVVPAGVQFAKWLSDVAPQLRDWTRLIKQDRSTEAFVERAGDARLFYRRILVRADLFFVNPMLGKAVIEKLASAEDTENVWFDDMFDFEDDESEDEDDEELAARVAELLEEREKSKTGEE